MILRHGLPGVEAVQAFNIKKKLPAQRLAKSVKEVEAAKKNKETTVLRKRLLCRSLPPHPSPVDHHRGHALRHGRMLRAVELLDLD